MIENTSKRDPIVHVVGTLGDPDGYITGMESAGQRQLVNSQQLPREGWCDEITALGIIRGDDVSGDDLFCYATLPEGWKREGSEHAMGSYIADSRGVRVVSIFYKAAFYDRRASMHPINPGHSLATEAIYGDGPAELPHQWPVLTDAEKADFRKSLDSYAAQAAEYPQIYGDLMPRLDRLVELLATAA